MPNVLTPPQVQPVAPVQGMPPVQVGGDASTQDPNQAQVVQPPSPLLPVGYDPGDLPAHLVYVADVVAGQANQTRTVDNGMALAMQGIDYRTQVKMKQDDELLQEFQRLSQETQHLSDDAFKKYADELGQAPQQPTMGQNPHPELGNQIAAALGAVLDPRHAAELVAIPNYLDEQHRKETYALAVQKHEGDMAVWRTRLGGYQDLAQILEGRARAASEAVKDAYRTKNAQSLNLLGIAKSLQDTASDWAPETVEAKMRQIGDLYRQAGYPELAPSTVEIQATKKALQDKAKMVEDQKDTVELGKNIRKYLDQLGSKNPGTRDAAAAFLNMAMDNHPDVFYQRGYDPSKVREALDGAAKVSEQERADIENKQAGTKHIDAQTKTEDTLRATKLAKAQADVDHIIAQTHQSEAQAANIKAHTLAYPAESQARIAHNMATLLNPKSTVPAQRAALQSNLTLSKNAIKEFEASHKVHEELTGSDGQKHSRTVFNPLGLSAEDAKAYTEAVENEHLYADKLKTLNDSATGTGKGSANHAGSADSSPLAELRRQARAAIAKGAPAAQVRARFKNHPSNTKHEDL